MRHSTCCYVSKLQTLALFLGLLCTFTQAAFYDCLGLLGGLKSDVEALSLVKKAHQEKLKFSSECLEVLLKKNFFLTSEYLLNDYYPRTSIDTEIIVKNVAADIKRSQDHLIFQIVKREKENQFPLTRPVVYWAQSPTEIHLQIKLQPKVDTPECRESFEREVVIEEDRVRVQAYCFESENDIQMYDSEEIEFKNLILPEQSSFEWKGDGKVILTLKKSNGASFWKYLLKDPVKEVKELQTWWEVRDRNIEILEDYIMEENAKEAAKRNTEL